MPYLKDETIIQNIKDVGQALIDNAEKIVMSYPYRQSITITCCVDDPDIAPHISIETEFVPEGTIKRFEDGTYGM